MIQPNELRIGNYYYLIEDDVDPTDVHQISDGYSLYQIWKHNNANPIPLTPEWLEKFGFEHNQKRCSYFKDEFSITQWDDGMFILSEHEPDEPEDELRFPMFQYVHQLQNLYFALTGNELEIKELNENG